MSVQRSVQLPTGRMPEKLADTTQARIIAGLLGAVERDAGVSQRRLAQELGIALGLVNAYLKRCVDKGFVKVRQAPSSRYAYYLTPRGLTEKSRLAAQYLAHSLSFFREARQSCAEVLGEARLERGWRRIAIIGAGDLAEIAMLCAIEQGLTVAAVLAPGCARQSVMRAPVIARPEDLAGPVDGWIVASVENAARLHAEAVRRHGASRVIVPLILGLSERAVEPLEV